MKKTLIMLAILIISYCCRAQTAITSSDTAVFARKTFINAASPVFYNSATGIISSQVASATQSGHLLSPDWPHHWVQQHHYRILGDGSGNQRLVIDNNGNAGIGTTTPDARLAVKGTIHAKEVKVDLNGWPDYVFKPTYTLPSLNEVKNYIDQNQHLPDMPSEQEVIQNGVNLGEMVKLQTKKIEELTYTWLRKINR